MINRHSLSYRIITRVLLITASLFMLILTVYYFYARSAIHKTTSDYAIQLAGNIVGKIEQELQPMEMIPQILGSSLEMGMLTPDNIPGIMQSILSKNDNIFGMSMAFEPEYFPGKGKYFMPYVFRDGDKIETTFLGGTSYEYFYMDWYQIPKMIGTSYWSEPYYDEGGGKILMATHSVPFFVNTATGRKFAGVATVDISLEKLTDFASDVKVLKTGFTFLLSRNGTILSHPDRGRIMNGSIFSYAEELKAPVLREIGRELMLGKSRFRDYNIPGRPDSWIYYQNMSNNGWSLGVVYPDKEIYASLTRMNYIIVALFIAGLIILTLSTISVVRRLASPLVEFAQSANIIAGGNFEVKLPEVKTRDEMLDLRNAFSNMQDQLAAYIENLRETTSAKEKIESELRIARDIQMSMIPHTFPPFPNLPQVDLFAVLKSAKEVGGDLYDFFLIDKSKFCFAIGDVSGKGVPASLIVAVTRTLLRSISDISKTPGAIMRSLNRSLSIDNDSCMFVTFFLGVLDLENGSLSYTNAGHNPPLLIRNDGNIIPLENGNAIPLGLQEEYPFSEHTIQLIKGDKIFSYTDGVTEAENSVNFLYGETRLIESLKEDSVLGPRELIKKIEAEVDLHVAGYAQSDDITMMAIGFNGNS